MKKTLALLALCLVVPVALSASPGEGHHVKATLVSVAGASVSGFVQLVQLPHGGTNIHVVASGLHAGTVYASFYYGSGDCSAAEDLLGSFTANAGGEGEV